MARTETRRPNLRKIPFEEAKASENAKNIRVRHAESRPPFSVLPYIRAITAAYTDVMAVKYILADTKVRFMKLNILFFAFSFV